MQSETGFPSSHQLKSYVVSKSHLKLAARAVLSADAGLLVNKPDALPDAKQQCQSTERIPGNLYCITLFVVQQNKMCH